MTEKEKLAKLEEIFELDEGTLKSSDVLDDLDCWDSMAALSLIVMMSDDFNKKITGNNIKEFNTVKDILDMMES